MNSEKGRGEQRQEIKVERRRKREKEKKREGGDTEIPEKVFKPNQGSRKPTEEEWRDSHFRRLRNYV